MARTHEDGQGGGASPVIEIRHQMDVAEVKLRPTVFCTACQNGWRQWVHRATEFRNAHAVQGFSEELLPYDHMGVATLPQGKEHLVGHVFS